VPEPLLGADAIERYLREVAADLPQHGPQHTVVVVGGALLAWHGLRAATRDVDSGRRIDRDLMAAVARVAARHDLAPEWLNDSAAAFVPATLEDADCEVLIDRPTLRVLGAPFDQVFLMKLNASRAADTEDLEALWPYCSFGSPEAAAEAFYEAFPLEERDAYLADHIRNVI
jgi:Nucleotidyltransferase of unknown function (DUF6036)